MGKEEPQALFPNCFLKIFAPLEPDRVGAGVWAAGGPEAPGTEPQPLFQAEVPPAPQSLLGEVFGGP